MQRIHGTFWGHCYRVTALGWVDLAVHRLTSISRIALLILTQLTTRVSTLRSLREEKHHQHAENSWHLLGSLLPCYRVGLGGPGGTSAHEHLAYRTPDLDATRNKGIDPTKLRGGEALGNCGVSFDKTGLALYWGMSGKLKCYITAIAPVGSELKDPSGYCAVKCHFNAPHQQ